MKEFFRKANGTLIVIALLAFVAGWQFGKFDVKWQWQNFRPSVNFSNQAPPSNNQNIDFKLFWETWDLVNREYVDKKEVDPQKLYYGAIQGMVAAIGDPYTVFLPPEQQKATQEELGGSFEGVGIQLGYNKDQRLVVIAPLKDTPADKAGILAGDIIMKIEGMDTNNVTLPDAVNKIRGEKGTKVALEVYREGEDKPRSFSLQRDTIIVKSVELSEKMTSTGKKVAVIKLTRFGERTNEEWSKAVSDTLAMGASGVVLDLRNNPGGFLQGAVFIGSEFIRSGDIVMQENAEGKRTGYKVDRMGKLLDIPVVVLINKGSASASEIVAGAIQDNKRGKLIGQQSFGKGTIQESQELTGGTGIHITTAKWLTPEGRWIHKIGLTPDQVVENPVAEAGSTTPAQDLQLDTAVDTFK